MMKGFRPSADTALHIAVVGHTNVGKTSLLRTLLRDVDFGEVSHRPSTTRHVEGAALRVGGEPLLVLHDTPGLEDGIGLRDELMRLAQSPITTAAATGERLDGPACIEAFLGSTQARGRYEQEAKVLRQLLAVQAGFYVIDVREPVLPKYRDELAVLAMVGKPLLPVFNFVRDQATHEASWREVLARVGLHAAVRFDSVTPPVDGEQRLYGSLAVLLETARPQLERLQAELAGQARERRDQAAHLVAELLVDVAAARRLAASDESALQAAVASLHEAVREREQRCTQALLALYAFRRGDAVAPGFPSFEGVWGDDLFNAETLRQFGVRLGGGMAAGAAVGAGVDVMLAGLSLGTAALVGALAGGAWQTVRGYGERWWGRVQGERVLRVDEAVLRLLVLRQRLLLRALESRGHAAQDVVAIDAGAAGPSASATPWPGGRLPVPLDKARAHASWSALNETDARGALSRAARAAYQDPARQAQVEALAQALHTPLFEAVPTV